MKKFTANSRAFHKHERQNVRRQIREEILEQRALRIAIQADIAGLQADFALLELETDALLLDAESFRNRFRTWAECQVCEHSHRCRCKDSCLYDTYPAGTLETEDPTLQPLG